MVIIMASILQVKSRVLKIARGDEFRHNERHHAEVRDN